MRLRTALPFFLAVVSITLAPFPGERPHRKHAQVAPEAPRERVRAVRVESAAQAAAPVSTDVSEAARAEPVTPGPGRRVVLTHLVAREGHLGRIARDLIEEHRGAIGLDGAPGRLELAREFTSLAAHHVRFRQTLGEIPGVPVFGSEVSAHVATDGRPLLVAADLFPLGGMTERDLAPEIDAAAARTEAVQVARDDDAETQAAVEAREPQLVILPDGKSASLAWRVDVRTSEQSLRVFVDAGDGTALRIDDLRIGVDGQGAVFDPNPMHSEGNPTFHDSNDKDSSGLTAARRFETLPRLDGTGFLRDPWVDLTPSPVLAFQADLDWNWVTRSHHAFEQVMCYFHIDRTQAEIQELGFANVNARQQDVDAHAGSSDQSFFDLFDRSVNFGDGGVDDGEDADVIVHEYGHAIQHDQVDDFGVTGEGGAMGEGFGDWLAVMMHESSRPNWDPLFASWDAAPGSNKTPPYLRRVDRNKVFPKDTAGEVHEDGEIWSRFLYDVRHLVGRDDALRLVIESHFLLTSFSRFRDGTEALLITNLAMREGRNDASLRAAADARGLPFLVLPAELPPEEASEENDTRAEASDLNPGVYQRYVLADDDWFRVVVPPFRRYVIRMDFDPAGMDAALTVEDQAGQVAAVADGVEGVEELEITAATAPRTVYLRIHHADPDAVTPAPYDLAVVDAELESFTDRHAEVRRFQPGDLHVFRVSVNAAKVDDGAALKVRTNRRAGSPAEIQALRPGGSEFAPFEDSKRRRNAVVKLVVDEPGDWVFAVRPRKAKSGRYVLKIKLR